MSENVNHPKHYNFGKIEVIEFIEDQKLNYHRGQIIKYTVRAGRKDPEKEIEDLEKAVWYLRREIALIKSEKSGTALPRPNSMTPSSVVPNALTSDPSLSGRLVEPVLPAIPSPTSSMHHLREQCKNCGCLNSSHRVKTGECPMPTNAGKTFKGSGIYE